MFSTPAYRRYTKAIQPAYSTPVANTVKKYLDLQYLSEKMKLQKELQQQVAVGLTYDFWTSNTTQSYITTTAHYIDINWILRHPVLATRRLLGHHTGKFINSALQEIAQEFHVNTKIAGLTTDNASNMKKAASLQEFITCSDAAVNCVAHTLQLAVENGLKVEAIQMATAEARKCVTHFHKLGIAHDALEQF